MTIEEMKARKAELGYTNETVSRLSGVPLGTVQKIFAGETKSPRYDTVQKLTKLFCNGERKEAENKYSAERAISAVMEPVASYGYEYNGLSSKLSGSHMEDIYLKPPKKTIGIADGKYRMPPDELFFDDEISGMFEESLGE